MDFLNIQDGGWLVSLPFNISETKHVIKKLTTDIIVTSKVLIDKSERKYIAIPIETTGLVNYRLRSRRFPVSCGSRSGNACPNGCKKSVLVRQNVGLNSYWSIWLTKVIQMSTKTGMAVVML